MENTTIITQKPDIAQEVGDRLFKFITIDEKGLTQEIEKMITDHSEFGKDDLLWIITGVLESHYDITVNFSTLKADMNRRLQEHNKNKPKK